MKIKFKSTILENSSELDGFLLSLKNEFGDVTINDEVFKLTTKAPIQFFMRPGRIDVVSFVTTVTMENVKTLEKSEMDFHTLLTAENLMDALLDVLDEFHEKHIKSDENEVEVEVELKDLESEVIDINLNLLLTSSFGEIDDDYLEEVCATTDETEHIEVSPVAEKTVKEIEKENILILIDFYLEQENLDYQKLTELSKLLNKYD